MSKSNFRFDLRQELALIHIYYFLNIFFRSFGKIIEIERVYTDISKQLLGIDFLLKDLVTGKIYRCDAKFQTKKYINNPTNTFSLECLYLKNGKLKKGWFPEVLDGTKVTDIFMFVWIHDAKFIWEKDDKRNLVPFIESWDNVNIADIMFVYFDDIKKYLADGKRDLGYDDIMKISKDLFYSNEKKRIVKGVKFVKSDSKDYAESPINIVLSKEVYKNMPRTRMYVYTKEDKIFQTSDYIYNKTRKTDDRKDYINETDYKAEIERLKKTKYTRTIYAWQNL